MREAHLAGYLLADILRWQLPSCKDRRTRVPCKTGFTVSTLTNNLVTWNFYFQSLLQYLGHLQLGLSLPGAFITIDTVLLIILFCFDRILNILMKVVQIWQFFTFSLTLPAAEVQANKNPQHLLQSLASQYHFATSSSHWLPLTTTLPCWASRLHTLWSTVLYLPGCRALSHQEWPSFFYLYLDPCDSLEAVTLYWSIIKAQFNIAQSLWICTIQI